MSVETCAKEAKEFFKDSDVKLRSGELEDITKVLAKAEQMDVTPAQKKAILQNLSDQLTEREMLKRQAERYMSANQLAEADQMHQQTTEAYIAGGMKPDHAPWEALKQYTLGGSKRPGVGSNLDLFRMGQTLKTDYLGALRAALGANEKVFASAEKGSQLVKDFYQEAHAIETGSERGLSNNPLALEIAKAVKATQEKMLQDLKSVNPFMGAAKDFIVGRNHDRDLIVAAGQKAWLQSAMTDFAPSFFGMSPEEKLQAFQGIYKDIAAGTHGGNPHMTAGIFDVRGISGDQARAFAQSRTLQSAGWEAEWHYMTQFGEHPFLTMINACNRNAEEVAAQSKWGPRPAEAAGKLWGRIMKRATPEQAAFLEGHKDEFQDMFKATMGTQQGPMENMMGRITAGALTHEYLALGGNHVPRALNSFPAAMTLTRDAFGKTLPQNAFEIMGHVIQKLAPFSDRDAALRSLGVASFNAERDLLRVVGAPQSKLGAMARLGEIYGKLSLRDYQVKVMKWASASTFADHLGQLAHLDFASLPEGTSELLKRYGITSPEWNAVRKSVQESALSKNLTQTIASPEGVRAGSDDTFRQYAAEKGLASSADKASGRQIQAGRLQVALRLGTLLNDIAGTATGEANSAQRYYMYGKSNINTGIGMARRLFWQFKQAGLIQKDIAERTYRSGGGNTSNLSGLAGHLILSGFMGMIGEYAIQGLAGKPLANPTSPEMLARFGMESGGMGVWGDAIINAIQSSKGGTDTAENLALQMAGPATSTAFKALGAIYSTGKGVAKSATENTLATPNYGQKDWARLIQSNAWGHNIFYLKGAADYFLFNEMHEFMGGNGYLEALRKQTDQDAGWPQGSTPPVPGFDFGRQNFWGE